MFFGKEVKLKVAMGIHCSQTETDVSPKITLKPEFFSLIPFFFSVVNGLFKNMRNFQFINFEIRNQVDQVNAYA